MANDKNKISDESQKKVDTFTSELDKLSQRIISLGSDLDVNLAGGLQKAINEAKKMTDPLKDSVSITSKLNKLIDENEILLIKRKVLEDQYKEALKGNDNTLQSSLEKKFKQISSLLFLKVCLKFCIRIKAFTNKILVLFITYVFLHLSI
jgi:uncharacterized phage infection (PIP) family protein YhgE